MWGAAAARAVVRRVRPQGAVEAARAALQEIPVGARQAPGLDAIACQTGAVTGFTRAIGGLIETAVNNQNVRQRWGYKTVLGVKGSSVLLWAV